MGPRSPPPFADLLETHRDEIVKRWLARVRADLDSFRAEIGAEKKSDPELADSLPSFLVEMARALRTQDGSRGPKLAEIGAEHGEQRFRIGADIEDVVREYAALRDVLIDLLEEMGCPVHVQDLRVLNDAISLGTAKAVRQLALERENAARDLRHRAEFERQLVAIVSHDLRSPLTTILLATAAVLQRSEAVDERTLKAVARIRGAAERATSLIHDLLDFTSVRMGGGIRVSCTALDFHAHVAAAAQEIHLNFPERKLDISQDGPGQGCWDPGRVAQIVSNLLNNAAKYSPAPTPIALRTHGDDAGVVLEVENQGVPIDPELLPHLFEPLQRGPSGTGIGLGLFIVDQIARAHGGTVEARSTAETGTTFTVRLPRTPAPPG